MFTFLRDHWVHTQLPADIDFHPTVSRSVISLKIVNIPPPKKKRERTFWSGAVLSRERPTATLTGEAFSEKKKTSGGAGAVLLGCCLLFFLRLPIGQYGPVSTV